MQYYEFCLVVFPQAMECDGGAVGASVNGAAVKEQHLPPQATSHEEEDDGWTVVRRKK